MAVSTHSIFDERHFVETRRGLNQASNLPGFCYTSQEWYEREVEEIFFKEWLCVGRGEMVAKPGDYLTLSIAGEPVLIVRDQDHSVHAFSNVCRHRACVLVEGNGNCGSFVCPYHKWGYNLKGELMGTPGRQHPMDSAENFDRAEHGLVPIKLETWGGFLFINFNLHGQTLLSWLGDLPERFKNYKMDELCCARTMTQEVQCNWKVFLENSVEEYHVETLHRAHLPKDNPNLTLIEESHGPYVMRYTPASITAPSQSRIPVIEGLNQRQREGTYPMLLFPNLNLIAGNHFVKFLQIFPDTVDTCTIIMNFCFPPNTVEQDGFEEFAQTNYYRYTWALLEEDFGITPFVQRGLAARLRRIGRFSKQEGAVYGFENYVLDRVLNGR